MNERQARALMMPYLDSELDARTTAEVADYLERSDEARRRYDAEAGLEAWITDSLRDDEMPPEVWRRVQLRLGVITPPMWPKVVAAAAVVLIAVTGWFFATREPNDVLRALAGQHRALVAGDLELELETDQKGDVRQYLVDHGVGSVPIVTPRTFKGHPVSIVGARVDEVLGVPGVRMVFRCCDDVVSVFVLPEGVADQLPDTLHPDGEGPRQGATGSLRVETMRREDHVLTIMSGEDHRSMVAAML